MSERAAFYGNVLITLGALVCAEVLTGWPAHAAALLLAGWAYNVGYFHSKIEARS